MTTDALPGPADYTTNNTIATMGCVATAERVVAGGEKVCSHCGRTETPIWRKGLNAVLLCNAVPSLFLCLC